MFSALARTWGFFRSNQVVIRTHLKSFWPEGAARRSMAALIDQGVSSATNFVTGVLIGRVCAVEEYGLFVLGLTIFQFAASLQAALLHVPYLVYSPRLEGGEYRSYRAGVLIHQLAISVLAFAALGVASRMTSGFDPGGKLARVLAVLSIVVIPMLLRELARCVCFAALKAQVALILDACTSFIQLSALLLLARFQLLSARSAYIVIGIACTVGILEWLFLERKQFSFRAVNPIAAFRKNWETGKWVLASSVVWVLSSYMYPWILAAFHGTKAAGVWAACFGVVASFNPIVLGLQNAIVPLISHSYSKHGFLGMRSFSAKALVGIGGIITPFSVAIAVFGGYLLSFIYGSKYGNYGVVVSVLALNILVSILTVILSRVLLVIGKGKVDLLVNVFSLFLLASVGLWLTRSYGVLGAAAGLMLGGLSGLILRTFAYFRLVWWMRAKTE